MNEYPTNGTRVRHTPSGEVGTVSNGSGRPRPTSDGTPVVMVRFDRVPDWNLGKGLADWAAKSSAIRISDLESLDTWEIVRAAELADGDVIERDLGHGAERGRIVGRVDVSHTAVYADVAEGPSLVLRSWTLDEPVKRLIRS